MFLLSRLSCFWLFQITAFNFLVLLAHMFFMTRKAGTAISLRKLPCHRHFCSKNCRMTARPKEKLRPTSFQPKGFFQPKSFFWPKGIWMIGSRCWMLGSRESLFLIIIILASLGFGGNLSHCSSSIFPPSYWDQTNTISSPQKKTKKFKIDPFLNFCETVCPNSRDWLKQSVWHCDG